MKLQDILGEARLPLLKQEMNRVRGSYGAFVITMHPNDFLRLTACSYDSARIEAAPFPATKQEWDDNGHNPSDFGRFPIPFLNVEHPSGRVVGHEGRHRAVMIARQGGEFFPVVIYLRADTTFEINYEIFNHETEYSEFKTEDFSNYDMALDRKQELQIASRDVNSDISYFGIKIKSRGGEKMKGSPAYHNPEDLWEKKAFTPEDMPKQLLAQHNSSIVVTDYRIGVVKGYRHFR